MKEHPLLLPTRARVCGLGDGRTNCRIPSKETEVQANIIRGPSLTAREVTHTTANKNATDTN